MNLLMLTKFYPFGTGEAFIENEIGVISEYFEKIVIIACEVPKNESRCRVVPQNVVVRKVLSKSKKKDIFKGLLHSQRGEYDFKMEKKKCKNIFQKIFLCYFEEKSQRIYDEIFEQDFLNELLGKPYMIYSYWLFTTARIGTLIDEKYNAEYMYTRTHRYDLYENQNKLRYLPYRKFLLQRYNDVFPCSDNGTIYLKKMYGDDAKNVRTALLGTLDHGIGCGSEDEKFRIVSCSRLDPVKRVNKIVEALKLLDNKYKNIIWTHIGGGKQYKIIKIDAEQNLHNIKVNLMGNMENKDIMKLYSTQPFDLFINVSSSEGLPVSIMEALSFGIPCIATDVGGTSEIVIEGLTGNLLNCEFEVEDLANLIEKYISGENKKISRECCRKYWSENFQAKVNYNQMYKYIRDKEGQK